jgi:hypothetical protein
MHTFYQNFIGTADEWASENPRLYNGVLGIETNGSGPYYLKIGDGIRYWQELDYLTGENIKGLPQSLQGIIEMLAQEAAARAQADGTLQENIDAETEAREQTDAALQEEEEARAQADNTLQGNIDTEAAAREHTDTALQAEAAARAQADNTLQGNINTEAAARAQADNTLQGNINTKIARAAAGEPGTLMQSITVKEATSNGVILRGWNRNVNTPGDPIPADMALPVASGSQAGVMPAESFSQVGENTVRIEALEGRAIHYPVTLDSATPSQEDLQEAYEDASGNTGAAPDQATLDDMAFGKSYTWYETEETWIDRGSTIIAKFTNASAGVVKGANADGKVFAEEDGTGSVVGWDALKTEVSNEEAARAAGDAAEAAARAGADEDEAAARAAGDTAEAEARAAGDAAIQAQVAPPVGYQYTQYPSVASNDFDTAFPSAKRPESLWPGTLWNKLWESEEVFFRTGGSLSTATGRTDGKQAAQSQLPSHTHTGPSHTHSGPSHTHSFSYDKTNLTAALAGGTVAMPYPTGSYTSTSGTTGSGGSGSTGSSGTGNTGSAYDNNETRPVNRRIVIWERYE